MFNTARESNIWDLHQQLQPQIMQWDIVMHVFDQCNYYLIKSLLMISEYQWVASAYSTWAGNSSNKHLHSSIVCWDSLADTSLDYLRTLCPNMWSGSEVSLWVEQIKYLLLDSIIAWLDQTEPGRYSRIPFLSPITYKHIVIYLPSNNNATSLI